MREGNQLCGNITQYSTGYLQLASGTTAQRPSSPVNGTLRFNTDTGVVEIFQGGVWLNNQTTAANTGNVANTLVLRDGSGNFSAGTITAALAGNAATATKLATARTTTFTGDVTGSETFDGSTDLSTALTLSATGVTAGSYTAANVTVDAKGRVTAISTGPAFQRLFYAEQLDDPAQSDWSVAVVAPAKADATYPSLAVRAFDDTAEEGIGFLLAIPSGVTTMTVRFKGRASTAPTTTPGVVMRLHRRTIPIGSAPSATWSITTLSTLSITNNAFFQTFSQTFTLTALGLTAGALGQFEITRQGSATADTLSGDWLLVETIVEFA